MQVSQQELCHSAQRGNIPSVELMISNILAGDRRTVPWYALCCIPERCERPAVHESAYEEQVADNDPRM
jgi:hypothetical protein